MKNAKKFVILAGLLMVFNQIIPYSVIFNYEKSDARFTEITLTDQRADEPWVENIIEVEKVETSENDNEKSVEDTRITPAQDTLDHTIYKEVVDTLADNLVFTQDCDNLQVIITLNDENRDSKLSTVYNNLTIGLYEYDERYRDADDLKEIDSLRLSSPRVATLIENELSFDVSDVEENNIAVFVLDTNDEPVFEYPVAEQTVICSVVSTYTGAFTFNGRYDTTGDTLTATIQNGQPSVWGTLHKTQNGVTTTSPNWVRTDASGNAILGPWYAPSSDEKATNVYISWPGGGQTNSEYHYWDVTAPNITISNTNFSTNGFAGIASDGQWGTGFDFSPTGWANSEATFYDATANKYYSLSSGSYNNSGKVYLSGSYNCTNSSCTTFNWSISSTPAENVHVCDHEYVWTFYTNDYFYNVDKEYNFTYTCAPINDPPVAVITTNPNPPRGITPLSVNFNGSDSYDTDGTVVSYEWDFNYTTSFTADATGVTSSHLFNNTGTTNKYYTAALRVTDDDGATDIETVQITVYPQAANQPPVAVINTTPNPPVGATPLNVLFNGLNSYDTDGTVVTYEWDFNYTTTFTVDATGATTSHMYTNGTQFNRLYTAALRVTDDDGATDIKTIIITVYPLSNQNPVAVLVTVPEPPTGNSPLLINFDGTNSYDTDGTISTYEWDFNYLNGSFTVDATGGTTNRTYTNDTSNEVSYIAALRVTDNRGGTDIETTIVTVLPPVINHPPMCTLTANPTTGHAPLNVTFNATMSDPDPGDTATAVRLYYGDLSPFIVHPSFPLTHIYESKGVYTAVLTVRDIHGVTNRCSTTVEVTSNTPPNAVFIASPTTGKAPLDVDFDASASNDPDGTIVSYKWNYGDGVSGIGVTASHTYTNPGTYDVLLTVTDNDGAIDTATSQIIVTENQLPIAEFTANPTNGRAPLDVAFDASASHDPDGTIVSYEWDFGDTGTGSGVTSNHTFASEGIYTVTLTVTDNDGDTDTATRTIIVQPNRVPIAVINANPQTGTAPLMVDFDGSSSYDPDGDTIVSYAWDFGDTNIGSGAIINHEYQDPGVYTAILTVTDSYGLTGSAQVIINVLENRAPIIDADILTKTNVRNNVTAGMVNLQASAFDPDGDTMSYSWLQIAGSDTVALTDDDTLMPYFTGLAGNWYVFRLSVDDNHGHVVTDIVVINMEQANSVPYVDADITTANNIRVNVTPGVVQLNGMAIDPDGDTMDFQWTLLETSASTSPSLNDDTILDPTFTGIAGSYYVWELVADDNNGGIGTDTVLIVMRGSNQPPVADAGPDQTFVPEGAVQLDGSGSYDPDGDPFTYGWQQIGGSDIVSLDDNTLVNPSFGGVNGNWYEFELTVTDSGSLTDTDTVLIIMIGGNRPPVADAGPDQSFIPAGIVNLDGTGSYDPDSDPIFYSWQQTGGTGTALLSDPFIAEPWFTGVLGETYEFELTVADIYGATDTDTVLITMNSIQQLVINTDSPTLLYTGETISFRAYFMYADGTSTNVTTQVQWDSSDTNVGTIISYNTYKSGQFTALNPGQTEVSASYSGLTSNSINVVVQNETLDEIVILSLNEESFPSATQPLVLPADIEYSLHAYGLYTNGATRNLTNSVNWVSSNSGAVSVHNNVFYQGVIETNTPNSSANITATLSGVTSNNFVVNVSDATITQIEVKYEAPRLDGTVSIGQEIPFYAFATYSDASTLDITDSVVWSSTGGLVVSNTRYFEGYATATNTGFGTVTATHGGLSDAETVFVNNIPLNNITIEIDPVRDLNALVASVPVSVPRIYRATGHYADGTNVDITNFVTWHSNNVFAANVYNYRYQEGYARTFNIGSADISVQFNGVDSNVLTLTVNNGSLSSLDVTSPAVLAVGAKAQGSANGTFTTGSYNVTRAVIWGCSNPYVCTVSNDKKQEGTLFGVGAGSTNVRIDLGSMNDTNPINVAVKKNITAERDSVTVNNVTNN